MMNCVLSYAEAEKFEAKAFFYDHDLAEYNPEKTPKQYRCLYCDAWAERSDPEWRRYLFVCKNCGWWQIVFGGGGFGVKSVKTHRGKLREYPVDALDVPLTELRAYLRRHPNDVALVNPKAFERLMGDCLKDKYGPCEVFHVGGTADRGVDLILVRPQEGHRLVQVKRRANLASAEGVQVVRALNGVLFRENVANGMVITTASRFTKAAITETNIWTPTGQTYDMELMAYNDVVELFDIEPTNPHQPWLRFLEGEG
jgi:hypothetical protein